MASRKPVRTALFAVAGTDQDAPLDPRAADELMRWVGVAMFVLGSATLFATLPMPDPNTSDHPAIEVIAGLLLAGAAFVFLLRPGRRWVSRVTVVYGILLVSALMAVTRPIEATPFFYLWPLVFSAYFCSRREVAADLALTWVTLGLGLFIWGKDPMKPGLFMGVGVSVTLVTVVVKLLAEHVSAVIRQLERAADTDYLTGLLNRRAFDLEFREQCDRARRNGLPLALATFDLDHFKQINDRHGHAEGDRVLREFAALLERELRGGDTLARVGGEEFAVVLFGVGLREAVGFAERIGRELAGSRREASVVARGGAEPGPALSTSAGVAELSARTPDPAALMLAADRALYAAKAAGRRRVAVWEGGATRVEAHIDGGPPLREGEGALVARAL
ncbi:MAG TPA: GGDEF domain-containing protein [Solirubrobacteraceae bacterium]|nr:GGDEF domain-containing protein [Solirubrobacteraceae bacterium]